MYQEEFVLASSESTAMRVHEVYLEDGSSKP
jgi:hypothetical protein